jgi:hypothetical protein
MALFQTVPVPVALICLWSYRQVTWSLSVWSGGPCLICLWSYRQVTWSLSLWLSFVSLLACNSAIGGPRYARRMPLRWSLSLCLSMVLDRVTIALVRVSMALNGRCPCLYGSQWFLSVSLWLPMVLVRVSMAPYGPCPCLYGSLWSGGPCLYGSDLYTGSQWSLSVSLWLSMVLVRASTAPYGHSYSTCDSSMSGPT